jgi:hypothetical protein
MPLSSNLTTKQWGKVDKATLHKLVIWLAFLRMLLRLLSASTIVDNKGTGGGGGGNNRECRFEKYWDYAK